MRSRVTFLRFSFAVRKFGSEKLVSTESLATLTLSENEFADLKLRLPCDFSQLDGLVCHFFEVAVSGLGLVRGHRLSRLRG